MLANHHDLPKPPHPLVLHYGVRCVCVCVCTCTHAQTCTNIRTHVPSLTRALTELHTVQVIRKIKFYIHFTSTGADIRT